MSNWELSTARATAVVRLMESQGINCVAAVGYGEHQPRLRTSQLKVDLKIEELFL